MLTQNAFAKNIDRRNVYLQKIEQLKSQLVFKETEFIKKKQRYEQIIQTLQDQNNRLKQLINLTESAEQRNSKYSNSNYPQQNGIATHNAKKASQSQKQLDIKDHQFLHTVQSKQQEEQSTARKVYDGRNHKGLKNYKSNQNYFTLGNSKPSRNQHIYVNEDHQIIQFQFKEDLRKLSNKDQFGSGEIREINNDQLPSFSECSRVQEDSSIPQLKIPEYNYQQLIRANEILKEEITNLTNTYQRQLQQLTFYFQKIKAKQEDIAIKNNSFDGTQRASKAHYQGQIKLVLDSYQATVNDFGKQRQKYRLKILQMDQYKQISQARIKQLHQQILRLQRQLKISQESIKTFFRLS